MDFEKAVTDLQVLSYCSPGPMGKLCTEFLVAMQHRPGVFDLDKLEGFEGDYLMAVERVLEGVKAGLCVRNALIAVVDS